MRLMSLVQIAQLALTLANLFLLLRLSQGLRRMKIMEETVRNKLGLGKGRIRVVDPDPTRGFRDPYR